MNTHAEKYEEKYSHLQDAYSEIAASEVIEYRVTRTRRTSKPVEPYEERVMKKSKRSTMEIPVAPEGHTHSRDQLLDIIQRIGEEAITAGVRVPAFIVSVPCLPENSGDFA